MFLLSSQIFYRQSIFYIPLIIPKLTPVNLSICLIDNPCSFMFLITLLLLSVSKDCLSAKHNLRRFYETLCLMIHFPLSIINGYGCSSGSMQIFCSRLFLYIFSATPEKPGNLLHLQKPSVY